MLLSSALLLLCSNAVSTRRDKSILYARVVLCIMVSAFLLGINSFDLEFQDKGIGLFHGLFHTTAITHIFHLFIFIICAFIIQLNGFYPRKIWTKKYSSLTKILFSKFDYFNS